jgi:hypothetical protein
MRNKVSWADVRLFPLVIHDHPGRQGVLLINGVPMDALSDSTNTQLAPGHFRHRRKE